MNKRLIFPMLVAGLILSGGASYGFAAQDFTGTWALDLKASDSVDQIMKEQGFNNVERVVAGKINVTQTITQAEDHIHIRIESTVKTEEEDIYFDGKKRTRQGR